MAGGYGDPNMSSMGSWATNEEDQQTHQDQVDWFGLYQTQQTQETHQTPPPIPTQDTQTQGDGSTLPPRNVVPPRRYGWDTPTPGQPRDRWQ